MLSSYLSTCLFFHASVYNANVMENIPEFSSPSHIVCRLAGHNAQQKAKEHKFSAVKPHVTWRDSQSGTNEKAENGVFL